MTTNQQIAEAFSAHRFAEVAEHLADDVRWISVGGSVLEGRDAVTRACQDTLTELAGVDVEFTRFVSVADAATAAVDAIGRYVDQGGNLSVVSSADIYEFRHGKLATVTSYAVELEAPEADPAPAG